MYIYIYINNPFPCLITPPPPPKCKEIIWAFNFLYWGISVGFRFDFPKFESRILNPHARDGFREKHVIRNIRNSQARQRGILGGGY